MADHDARLADPVQPCAGGRPPARPRAHRPRGALAALNRRAAAGGLGLGLGAGFNISTVGPAADVLASEYGVRLGVVGFLTTALFATHLLSQLPGGRLIDRHGARKMGMLALATIIAGNALALAAGSLAVGIAGRLVTGLGTGVGFVAGSDYVRAKLGTPTTQGLYGGFSVGGAGLAIALVPLAALAVDWRAPYAAGLVMAAVFLVVLWTAPRDEVHAGARRDSPWTMMRDRRLYPLAVIHTASFGFSVIVGIWTVSLFEHDGYRSEVGGVIGALTLLGGLVTRPLGGRMMERWPQQTKRYVELSMLAAAGGTVLLLLDVAIPVRVLGAAILGLAAGIPFAYAFTRAQQIRADAPALATGFVNSCATLTILVGAPLVGFTFALPGGGSIGFAVVAVLWAAAALPLRGERTADALAETG